MADEDIENEEIEDSADGLVEEDVEFDDADTAKSLEDRRIEAKAEKDLEFIIDVPFEVSAELGRTSVDIRTLLQLGVESVIEVEKLAGEPLEILINGKLVSRGEVIVVNENYGMRLTDIVSSRDTADSKK